MGIKTEHKIMTENQHNFEKLLSDANSLGIHGSDFSIRKYNQPENKLTFYRLTLETPIKEFEGDNLDTLFHTAYKYLEKKVAERQKQQP